MNPWLFPWLGMFKGPLSGDVTQDISPITRLLSPQFEFNFAGDRDIESEVVADVASYGKQLGILSEALIELADGQKGEAVDRLKKLTIDIETIKNQHKDKLEKTIKADLDKLKQQDPEKLKQLIDAYK